MANKLSAGTVINLHGTNVALVLPEDTPIQEIPDKTYVGLLMGDKHNNWPVNIGNVEGNWNPVTGAEMPYDCTECGNPLPETATEAGICETCKQVAAQRQAIKDAEEKQATDAKSKKVKATDAKTKE